VILIDIKLHGVIVIYVTTLTGRPAPWKSGRTYWRSLETHLILYPVTYTLLFPRKVGNVRKRVLLYFFSQTVPTYFERAPAWNLGDRYREAFTRLGRLNMNSTNLGVSTSNSSKISPTLYDQLNLAVDRMPMTGAHYRLFLIIAAGSMFNAIEQYNVGYAAPILTDYWDLTQTAVGFLSTVTFAAMALGALLSGYVADRIGRRTTFMINIALFTFGALLAAFSPDYTWLFVARIVIGLGLGGEMSLGFTVLSELMPTKRRARMTAALSFAAGGVGMFAAAGLATLMLGPLANLLGGEEVAWRWFFGFMFLPAVIILFVRIWIPETPRYLLQRGRIYQTNRVISLLANNRLRDSDAIPVTPHVEAEEGTLPAVSRTRSRPGDIFRGALLKRTLIGWTLITGIFAISVGLTLFMPTLLVERGFELSGSLGLSTVINLAGLLGGLSGIWISSRVPRRRIFQTAGLICAVFSLFFILAPTNVLAISSAALLAFTLQVLAASVWGYIPELYPTRIRGFAAGAASTVGLGASAFSPMLFGALMDSFGEVAVFTVIIIVSCVIALVSYFGPETLNKSLDESV